MGPSIVIMLVFVLLVFSPLIYGTYRDKKSRDKNGRIKCHKCGETPGVIYYSDGWFHTIWTCDKCTDWENI